MGSLAVFAAVFVLYLASAHPALAPRDAADLALAAATLGPAHPPGYPLYALLGKAWTLLLPLGNQAYRLNVLSAAAGAAAVAVVFSSVRRRSGLWTALPAAAALALSAPLWKFSGLGEKYSLHAFFLAASVASSGALGGLFFGLGGVNHQSLVLAAPALRWSKRFAVFAAAGLALYLAVLMRAGFGPGLDIVLRRDYGTFTLSAIYAGGLAATAPGLLRHLFLGIWPFLGGLAGGGRTLALFALTGPAYFLLTRFKLDDWVAATVLEPAFIAPSVALAMGMTRPAFALAGLLAFSPQWNRHQYAAYDYLRDLRRGLPEGTAAAGQGDTALMGLKYMGREVGQDLSRAAYATGFGEMPAGSPEGLWWKAGAKTDCRSAEAAWQRLSLRPVADESYARDVRRSYAHAAYLASKPCGERFALRAAALAPWDYNLEMTIIRP